jgi:hypothetical protein
MVQRIELSLIAIEEALQPRATMSREAITQYAEDMLAGVEFPPVRVWHIEGRGDLPYLTSGFHRYFAAKSAEIEEIEVEIFEGSWEDALWDAAQTNREFDDTGQRRTAKDRRRATEMALRAKPHLSNPLIADEIGVTDKTVASARRKLEATSEIPKLDRRTGKDGKERPSSNVKHENREDEPDTEDEAAAEMPIETDQAPDEPEPEPEGEPATEPESPFNLIDEPEPPESNAAFNKTNDMVEWALWTWNPVTGCEHNCVYCYARDIANRFYPEKFKPTTRSVA